jgi:hypothetical protein
MAVGDLLLASAFETHINDEADGTVNSGGTPAVVTTQHHSGGASLRVQRTSNATTEVYWTDIWNVINHVRGSVWVYTNTRPTANVTIFSLFGRSQFDMNIQMNATGVVTSRINNRVAGTNTVSSTIATLAAGGWHLIEFHGHSTSSLLSFSVRIDGGTPVTITRAATAAYQFTSPIFGTDSVFGTGNVTSTYLLYWDDFTLWEDDATGNFTGDMRVQRLVPDSAAANIDTTWTCSTGTNRAALVDEATNGVTTSTTDYVQSIVPNQVQRLPMTTYTLAAGESFVAAFMNGSAGSTGLNAAILECTLQNSAGTDSTHIVSPQINSSSANNFIQLSLVPDLSFLVAPGGGAWAQTDVDNLRFKLVDGSSTADPVKVYAVWVDMIVAVSPSTPQDVGTLTAGAAATGNLDVDVPSLIGPAAATAHAAASALDKVTAPGDLGDLTASAGATATFGATAPAKLTIGGASAISSGTLKVTAPAKLTIGGSSATATGSLTVSSSQPVGALAATATAQGSILVTTPTRLSPGGSTATASGALFVTSPTKITASATAQASSVLGVTAPSVVPGMTSSSTSTGALTLTAPTKLTLGGGSASANGTVGLTAPTYVFANGSASTAGALTIFSPTAQVVGSMAGSAAASGVLFVTTPVRLTFAASVITTGSMNATAPALVTFSGSSAATGALFVTTPTKISANASAQSSGTMSVTAPAMLTIGAATASGAGNLSVTSTTKVGGLAASGNSSGTLGVTAPTYITGAATATAAGALFLSTGLTFPLNGSAQASAVLSVTAPTFAAFSAAASAVGAVSITAPTRLGNMAATAQGSGVLFTTAPYRVTMGGAQATATGSFSVTTPVLLTMAATATSLGSLIVSTPGFQPTGPMNATATSFGTLLATYPARALLGGAAVQASASANVRAPGLLLLGGATATATSALAVRAAGLTGDMFGQVDTTGTLDVASPVLLELEAAFVGVTGMLSLVTADQGRSSTRTMMGMGM